MAREADGSISPMFRMFFSPNSLSQDSASRFLPVCSNGLISSSGFGIASPCGLEQPEIVRAATSMKIISPFIVLSATMKISDRLGGGKHDFTPGVLRPVCSDHRMVGPFHEKPNKKKSLAKPPKYARAVSTMLTVRSVSLR